MRAIIVEDEFLAREELKYFIKNYSSIEIVDEFEDGIEVLKFIQKNEIDVIFLDINILSLDGVLLAKNISKFSKKPYIVFITAYKEHAVEAFEIEAFDYILKPYHESRMISMLKKLELNYN
jgi:two-component system LytT family response regulator